MAEITPKTDIEVRLRTVVREMDVEAGRYGSTARGLMSPLLEEAADEIARLRDAEASRVQANVDLARSGTSMALELGALRQSVKYALNMWNTDAERGTADIIRVLRFALGETEAN